MAGKLTARKVATAGSGKYADGGGLYLIVDPKGTGRWFFIFSWQNKRPEMSLGRREDVPLVEAREAAASARRLVRSGVNPIVARKTTSISIPTFVIVPSATPFTHCMSCDHNCG